MGTNVSTRKRASGRTRKTPVRMLSRAQVPAAVRTLAEPAGVARFAAGKALAATAAKDPARVYPHFAALAALLDSDSKIVRWNAMQVLTLLAPADCDHKWDALLDRFLAFIRGDNMIPAANAIRGAATLAAIRPDLLDHIVPGVLAVEVATYETAECRNVAIGHALDALRELWPNVRHCWEVAEFVRRQRTNSRAAVARRAARLSADCPSRDR
jgi:hypothetical protein